MSRGRKSKAGGGIKSKAAQLYTPLILGGADSGFRHVTPDTWEPRLLHISGTRKNVEV